MGIWVRTIVASGITSIGLWVIAALIFSTWSAWKGPIEWNNGIWFGLHVMISLVSCLLIIKLVAPPSWVGALLTTLTYLVWLTILRQLYGTENQAMAWLILVFTMLITTILTATFVSKLNQKKKTKKYYR